MYFNRVASLLGDKELQDLPSTFPPAGSRLARFQRINIHACLSPFSAALKPCNIDEGAMIA